MIDLTRAQEAALARGRLLITERLCRTRHGRIVREAECQEGNLLFRIGDEVPLNEARKLGLITELPATPAEAVAPEVQVDPGEERARGVVRFGGKKGR